MLESLYVSNNYCEVYDVEGTGHLKSDSSVIGDSKVADIIFVALTALKYHYIMLLFTSPDNINIWNMNKFSMFFICYECMVSFYLLAGIFYPLQKKKTSTILEVWNCYYWIPINMYALSFIGNKKIEKWRKNGNGTVSSTPHRNSDWIQQKKSFITRKKVVIRGKQSANWSRDLFDWQPSE